MVFLVASGISWKIPNFWQGIQTKLIPSFHPYSSLFSSFSLWIYLPLPNIAGHLTSQCIDAYTALRKIWIPSLCLVSTWHTSMQSLMPSSVLITVFFLYKISHSLSSSGKLDFYFINFPRIIIYLYNNFACVIERCTSLMLSVDYELCKDRYIVFLISSPCRKAHFLTHRVYSI